MNLKILATKTAQEISSQVETKGKKVVQKGTKTEVQTQAQQGKTFLNKLYKTFFLPSNEKITNMAEGKVYTEQSDKSHHIFTRKKYSMWSRTPEQIVRDNGVTSLREVRIMHKDGRFDYVLQDMHNPTERNYVKYSNAYESGYSSRDNMTLISQGSVKDSKKSFWDSEELFDETSYYPEPIKISYKGKEIIFQGEDKRKAISKLYDIGDEKFKDMDTSINNLKNLSPLELKMLSYLMETNPHYSAARILSSPNAAYKIQKTHPNVFFEALKVLTETFS